MNKTANHRIVGKVFDKEWLRRLTIRLIAN